MSSDLKRKERQQSFAAGKLIIGLSALLLGLQTLLSGAASYDLNLHELRKTFFPGSQASDRLFNSITYEEFSLYLIKCEACLFLVSGFLILMNRKCLGSFVLAIAVIVMLVIKDYPLRHNEMKSAKRERTEKI